MLDLAMLPDSELNAGRDLSSSVSSEAAGAGATDAYDDVVALWQSRLILEGRRKADQRAATTSIWNSPLNLGW